MKAGRVTVGTELAGGGQAILWWLVAIAWWM